ncbi:MAG TPA: response regulator [Blastocatellia bacterium]|nr:response regulator [Blastocatellia bacterium]
MGELKIVLVEDNEDTRVLLTLMLESEGYQVTGLEDGIDALDIIKDSCPDAIITDLMMPGIDGLTFIQKAKALHPAVPIVLLSGNGDIIKNDALNAGACKIFVKPFDSDELLKTLRSLMLKHFERGADSGH